MFLEMVSLVLVYVSRTGQSGVIVIFSRTEQFSIIVMFLKIVSPLSLLFSRTGPSTVSF